MRHFGACQYGHYLKRRGDGHPVEVGCLSQPGGGRFRNRGFDGHRGQTNRWCLSEGTRPDARAAAFRSGRATSHSSASDRSKVGEGRRRGPQGAPARAGGPARTPFGQNLRTARSVLLTHPPIILRAPPPPGCLAEIVPNLSLFYGLTRAFPCRSVPTASGSTIRFLLDSSQNHGFSDTANPISTPTTSTISETEKRNAGPSQGRRFFRPSPESPSPPRPAQSRPRAPGRTAAGKPTLRQIARFTVLAEFTN
jgi:hypothetical protein